MKMWSIDSPYVDGRGFTCRAVLFGGALVYYLVDDGESQWKES